MSKEHIFNLTMHQRPKEHFGPNGLICCDLNGNRVYEGMQQASQLDLKHGFQNAVLLKPMTACVTFRE